MDMSHHEQVDKNKFSTRKEDKKEDTVYDSVGPDGLPIKRDSDFCVAKFLKTKGRETRYYIKRSTINNLGFFNPIEYELTELQSKLTYKGRDRWEFILTTEEAYNSYLQFLKTGNLRLLNQAERNLS